MLEIIATTGAAGLITVVGYFLKKQNDKIDVVDSKLAKMKSELKDDIKTSKKDMVEMFQTICHERQDACGKLTELKIESLKKDGVAICHKLTTIKEDRVVKWNAQDKLNNDIRRHLAKENSK